MPVDFLTSVFFDGPEIIPYWEQIKQYGPTIIPVVASIAGLKYYFRGATNTWERDLHGKVYIITGGTSGIGQQIVNELGQRGAQLILLVRNTNDQWLAEYIEDLRDRLNNNLIYAEQCNLASLHSIRKFATKWLDNSPPRRLDGMILCAAECLPRNKPRMNTVDGVESHIGINYLANFHLLTLLAPSLKVQPPDRDVRVLIATCSSINLSDKIDSDLLWEKKQYPSSQPWRIYGYSKLLTGLFAKEFQTQLNQFERKDKAPCNIRINLVNPGLVRTPSTRRFISMGSILGLLLYLLFFPIWWLFLKSVFQGAQSFYFGIMSPVIMKLEGGNIIQECKIQTKVRKELDDSNLQKKIYEQTESLIHQLEKKSAITRKKIELQTKTKEEIDLENKRKADITIKPETPEELQLKLGQLRNNIGIASGSSGLPLFPE